MRSLAALRMALGALLTLDLLARLPLADELYTDAGLLPRELLPLGVLRRTPLELYGFGGSSAWVLSCVVLTLACSVLFTLGFKTRVANVALWLLMAALFRRNPHATDGGDNIALCLLFWSMFLPMGARWSLDARHGRPVTGDVFSPASASLLLQPALVYLFAGLSKNSAIWNEGRAVLAALNQSQWVEPFGVWLRQRESLTRGLTYATRFVEIVAPLLLFLPLATGRARALGIGSLLALQVALTSALWLNFFPFYASVGWLAFVPSAVWDRVSKQREVAERTPIEAQGVFRRSASFLALPCLALGTLAGSMQLFTTRDDPALLTRAARALRISQEWGMYAAIVDEYLRLRTRGELSSGGRIDFSTDEGRLADSPVGDWARSYRGNAYLETLVGAKRERQLAFAKFVCERWNADPSHPLRLVAVELSERVIRRDAETSSSAVERVPLRQQCP